MLFQQLVQLLGLADFEVTGSDGAVVDTEDRVDVFHRLSTDVGELLDLGGGVLDLFVRHGQLELFHSGLDGVPASQSVTIPLAISLGIDQYRHNERDIPDGDISGHAKVGRVEDLVCRGVGKDRLGVNTSLVGEGASTGDVVVATGQ